MSSQSKIEWTEASWNPITGCTKISQGCKHCYAERHWRRLSTIGGNVYSKPWPVTYPEDDGRYRPRQFTDVECHPERLAQPLRWRKPQMIFVNSMSDLFHESVPDEFLDRVFAVMALARRHVFQVLTKRPERMQQYLSPSRGDAVFKEMRRLVTDECALGVMVARDALSERPLHAVNQADYWQWPLPNLWLGVSVEDQSTADARIPTLLQAPARVRWISAEPLLGPVNLDLAHCLNGCGWVTPVSGNNDKDLMCPKCKTLVTRCGLGREHGGIIMKRPIDWVVAGGETGPKARPMHPDWVRAIRDQCQAAAVPFFMKQWGEWAPDIMLESGRGDRSNSVQVTGCKLGDSVWMTRFGKKAAGRVLDNRLHDEYPRSSA